MLLVLGKKSVVINLNDNTNLDSISIEILNEKFTDRYFMTSEIFWLGIDRIGGGVEIESLFPSSLSKVYLGSGPLYSVPQDGAFTGV